MPEPIDERVARGVAYLDERYPGWRDSIDPDTLDMDDEERCILGQLDLWGDFDVWKYEVEMHGFDVFPSEVGRHGQTVAYSLLQDAWKEVLS